MVGAPFDKLRARNALPSAADGGCALRQAQGTQRPIVHAMTTAADAYARAQEAASFLKARFDLPTIDLAFVLGSGWSAAVDDLGEKIGELALADLPGFSA